MVLDEYFGEETNQLNFDSIWQSRSLSLNGSILFWWLIENTFIPGRFGFCCSNFFVFGLDWKIYSLEIEIIFILFYISYFIRMFIFTVTNVSEYWPHETVFIISVFEINHCILSHQNIWKWDKRRSFQLDKTDVCIEQYEFLMITILWNTNLNHFWYNLLHHQEFHKSFHKEFF